MLWTLTLNGIAGFVIAVTFAYCLGPIQAAIDPPYFFAFIGTFYTATHSHAGATVMSCIITSLTVASAITNVATGSRQMFAFARVNVLPFSGFLSYVSSSDYSYWSIETNGFSGQRRSGHSLERRYGIIHYCCTSLPYQPRKQRHIPGHFLSDLRTSVRCMGMTDPAAVEEAYAAYEAAQARLAALDYTGLDVRTLLELQSRRETLRCAAEAVRR